MAAVARSAAVFCLLAAWVAAEEQLCQESCVAAGLQEAEEPLDGVSTSLLQLSLAVGDGHSLLAVQSEPSWDSSASPRPAGAFACIGLAALAVLLLVCLLVWALAPRTRCCGARGADESDVDADGFVGRLARDVSAVCWVVIAFWCVATAAAVIGVCYMVVVRASGFEAFQWWRVEAAPKVALGDLDLAKVAGLSVPLALYQQCVYLGSGRLFLVAVAALAVSASLSLALVWLSSLIQTIDRVTPAVIVTFCLSSSIRSQLLLLSRFREELPKQRVGILSGRVLRAVGLSLCTSGHTTVVQALNQGCASIALALLPALALSSVGLASAFCSLFTLVVGLTLSPALLVACPHFFGKGAYDRAAESQTDLDVSAGEYLTAADTPFEARSCAAACDTVWSKLELLLESAQRFARGAFAVCEALWSPVGALRGRLVAEFHGRLARFVKGHRLLVLGLVAASCVAPGTGLLRTQLRQDDSDDGSRRHHLTPVAAASAPKVGPSVALLSWGAPERAETASRPELAPSQAAAAQEDLVTDRLPYVIVGMVVVAVLGNGIAYGSAIHPLRAVLGVASTLLFALGVSSYASGASQDPDPVLLSFFLLTGISLASDAPLYARSCELRAAGASNAEAVGKGLRDTSPDIVAAGVSTSVSFVGLLLCRSPLLRSLGATAVIGVLYDTFVSRCLLSPALMRLLGRFNWWPSALTPRSVPGALEAMDVEQRRRLQRVLERRRVEVDDGRGEIRLSRQPEFAKRYHGADSSAFFEDEAGALEILRDVADVLAIWRTADLDIEAHTATPDDWLDSWSHKLALHQAEKVQSTLETLGVDPERLSAVGRPGKLGTGRNEVLLRITDV